MDNTFNVMIYQNIILIKHLHPQKRPVFDLDSQYDFQTYEHKIS